MDQANGLEWEGNVSYLVDDLTRMHIDWETGLTVHLRYEPCIVMFTAQGKRQPGWLASQADMLADDWEIVPLDEKK